MTRQKATAIGSTAILMWALLALMTIGSAPVPPFLLNALCFGIGGAIGLVWIGFGAGFGVLRQISWKVYAFGTIGLFGYHALYFTAFRIAPFAETGLIAYLGPCSSCCFPAFCRASVRPLHVIGALVAFAGAGLIVMGRGAARRPCQFWACRWPFSVRSLGRPIRCCRGVWAMCRRNRLWSIAC